MDKNAREEGGRAVRAAWEEWARTLPDPKPHWLVPWEELDERDREAGRWIWDAVALPLQLEIERLRAALLDVGVVLRGVANRAEGQLPRSRDLPQLVAEYMHAHWRWGETYVIGGQPARISHPLVHRFRAPEHLADAWAVCVSPGTADPKRTYLLIGWFVGGGYEVVEIHQREYAFLQGVQNEE